MQVKAAYLRGIPAAPPPMGRGSGGDPLRAVRRQLLLHQVVKGAAGGTALLPDGNHLRMGIGADAGIQPGISGECSL